MPPFTITASPLAAAPAALLLSFLLLCKKKKNAIKAGQKQAGTQAVYLEKEEKNSKGRGVRVCVWGGDSSVGLHTTHYLCFMLEKILLDLLEHSRMNAISSKKLTQLLNVRYTVYFRFSHCVVSVPVLHFHS